MKFRLTYPRSHAVEDLRDLYNEFKIKNPAIFAEMEDLQKSLSDDESRIVPVTKAMHAFLRERCDCENVTSISSATGDFGGCSSLISTAFKKRLAPRNTCSSLAVQLVCAYLPDMAIRQILEVPDPRLKVVSQPVTEFDAELRTLVDDMFETMYDAPGIGLAAIQVGVPKRLLVIDLQPDDPDAEPEPCSHDGHHHHHQPTKKEPRVFVNPEILEPAEELATYSEGCLSVPEIYADVDRPSALPGALAGPRRRIPRGRDGGADGHLHPA